jgi:hypothetical protein
MLYTSLGDDYYFLGLLQLATGLGNGMYNNCQGPPDFEYQEYISMGYLTKIRGHQD